jgi:uncharacterized SAM-binding protein YcdF (DUF218 family)
VLHLGGLFLRRTATVVFFVLLVVGAISADVYRFAKTLTEVDTKTVFQNNVDLIVAFTGGQGRVREAFMLLEQRKGKYLFISGTTPGITLKSIFAANKISADTEDYEGRIFLDERARSTVGNAIEVRSIVERLEVKSLLLVTSSYHMKRSRELVERSLNRVPELEVQIFEAAVESPNFVSDKWHQNRTGWRILFSEYIKSRLGF